MREQAHLVSIITGYYNRSNHVDDSIQSLLNQSYDNIEIIIFDDNSSDDTFKQIKKIAETDKRVRFFKNNINIGFTKSLIHAVSIAKGEFIAIHGSGDISESTRIEAQMNAMLSDDNVAIVGCNSKRISLSGEVIETVFASKKSGPHPFLHAELLYRRSALIEVGGYRDFFIVGQGTDLWERILTKYKYKIVDEFLYSQVLVHGTLSTNKKKLIERELLARYRVILKKERKTGNIDSLDKFGNLFYLHQPSSVQFEWGYYKSFVRAGIMDQDLHTRLFRRMCMKLTSILFLPLYIVTFLIPSFLLKKIVKKTSFKG